MAHAVRAGSLWIRIARVQAQALSLLGPAAAATAIGKAANELQNLENNGSNGEIEWLTASAAEVLGQAGTLTPAVRAGCMPLFKATLLSIPFADSIATVENCRSLADSFLTLFSGISFDFFTTFWGESNPTQMRSGNTMLKKRIRKSSWLGS